MASPAVVAAPPMSPGKVATTMEPLLRAMEHVIGESETPLSPCTTAKTNTPAVASTTTNTTLPAGTMTKVSQATAKKSRSVVGSPKDAPKPTSLKAKPKVLPKAKTKLPVKGKLKDPPASKTDETAKPRRRRGNCICPNPACRELRAQILQWAPEGHPWRRGSEGLHLVPHKMMSTHNLVDPRVAVMKKRIAQVLKLDPETAAKPNYKIALHHWPADMIGTESNWSYPFHNKTLAWQADQTYCMGSPYFSRSVNSVTKILTDLEYPADAQAEWTNCYVKAPANSIKNVEAQIATWKNQTHRPVRASLNRVLPVKPQAAATVSTVADADTTSVCHGDSARAAGIDILDTKPAAVDTSDSVEKLAAANVVACPVAGANEKRPVDDESTNKRQRVENDGASPTNETQILSQQLRDAYSLETVTRYVQRRATECCYDATPLRDCAEFTAVVNHLHYTLHVAHVPMSHERHSFHVCPSYGTVSDCQRFSFRVKWAPEREARCEHCTKLWYKNNRKEQQKKEQLKKGHDPTLANSTCSIAHLSLEDLRKRMGNVTQELRKARATIRLLEKKVEDYEGVTESILHEVESLKEELEQVESHLVPKTAPPPKTRRVYKNKTIEEGGCRTTVGPNHGSAFASQGSTLDTTFGNFGIHPSAFGVDFPNVPGTSSENFPAPSPAGPQLTMTPPGTTGTNEQLAPSSGSNWTSSIGHASNLLVGAPSASAMEANAASMGPNVAPACGTHHGMLIVPMAGTEQETEHTVFATEKSGNGKLGYGNTPGSQDDTTTNPMPFSKAHTLHPASHMGDSSEADQGTRTLGSIMTTEHTGANLVADAATNVETHTMYHGTLGMYQRQHELAQVTHD